MKTNHPVYLQCAWQSIVGLGVILVTLQAIWLLGLQITRLCAKYSWLDVLMANHLMPVNTQLLRLDLTQTFPAFFLLGFIVTAIAGTTGATVAIAIDAAVQAIKDAREDAADALAARKGGPRIGNQERRLSPRE